MNDSISISGNRTTFSYYNNEKTVVTTSFSWDNIKRSWTPFFKDSIVFSITIPMISNVIWLESYSGFTNYTQWEYDESSNNWKNLCNWSRLDSECTNTRLVLDGFYHNGDTNSIVESKLILDFSSPTMTANTNTSQIRLLKDKTTGLYINYFKYAINYTTNGFVSSTETFNWDTSRSLWNSDASYFAFPDSYGNDTLSFNLNYDTTLSIWDTSFIYGYTRKYDSFGNNTEIIESSYSSSTKTWWANSKEINTFAQVNVPVKTPIVHQSQKSISYNQIGNKLIFSGNGIQGIIICNTQGRLLASIKQNTSDNLVLSTDNFPALGSGSYVAKILTSTGSTSLRLPICK